MEDKLNELSFKNALIIGLALAVMYYFFIYRPADVRAQLQDIEDQVAEVNGLIARKDKKIKKKQLIELELEELRLQLKKANSFIPRKLSIEEAVSSISQKARDVGLSIDSIGSTDTSWKDLKTVSYASVSVGFQGSYETLMFFLSDLTRDGSLVLSVSDMVLSSEENSEKLRITGSINVYRSYVEEKPKEGGVS